MRLRKRHAWGAALIALFALPVLRPQGLPALEDPVGGSFAWLAGLTPLNPRLWQRDAGRQGDDPRVRELERALAEVTEAQFNAETRALDVAHLLETLELDRLPVARWARVLRSSDPSPSRRSLLIDRGADDGLAEGFPVVSGGTLLGRVQVVRGRSALVRLITDPQARLEVALRTDTGRRVTGFLRRRGPGTGPDDLDVEGLRLLSGVGALREHAPVFSSNADPLVPSGLLVGYVSRVSDPEGDGFPSVTVEAALDLSRTTEVLVLLPRDER